MSNDEIVRLLLQVTGAEDLDDLRAKAAGARDKIDDLAGATDRAEKSTRNMGRATLEGGRILQDFAQGGIGGILNNIEGLSLALGGGPGLAGVMTALGLAAYFAIPAIKSALSAITEGSNPIPEAANKLDGLSEALEDVKDRLKELKEKGWLTDAELSEYNEKLADRVELEEKITAEKEKQATLDKSRNASKAGEKDADAAKEAQKVVDSLGGVDAVAKRIAPALAAESERSGEVKKLRDEVRAWTAEGRRLSDSTEEEVLKRDEMGRPIARYRPLDRVVGYEGKDGRYREVDLDDYINARIQQVSKKIDESFAGTGERAEDLAASALRGEKGAAAKIAELDPANSEAWLGATPEVATANRRIKKQADDAAKKVSQLQADAAKFKSHAREAEREEKQRDDELRKQKKKRDDELRKQMNLEIRAARTVTRDVNAKIAKTGAEAKRQAADSERDAEREAEKQARAALPGNRLQAMRDQAYQMASGIALAENQGEFTPAQLQGIARMASDNTGSLDVASIRQAVYQAAALTRIKIQQELDQQMRRLFQGGGFNYGGQ